MAPERCHLFFASEPNDMFRFPLNDLYWNFFVTSAWLYIPVLKRNVFWRETFSVFNFNIETKLIVKQFAAAAQYLSASSLKKRVPQDGVMPPPPPQKKLKIVKYFIIYIF